eukprot:3455102-Heterocapsa_arctica.AAC.1
MNGGAALRVQLTRDSALLIRTNDGTTLTAIIVTGTVKTNFLDIKTGRKLIAERLKTKRIQSSKKRKDN